MTTTLMPVLEIPPGFGFAIQPRSKWISSDPTDLMDSLLIWELPRRTERYVVSADISSGTGLDRSVIDVTRVGTLQSPEEQVAQFITNSITPEDLAGYIDAIGNLYKWAQDDLPALVAIECNGMGLSTQTELLQHRGYTHLFIWRHEDAINPRSRYSRAYGWYTNRRTRPMIISRFFNAVTTLDERTGDPEYIINSPFTLEEMRDFQTPGPLWMAEADPSNKNAHDDCIMAAMIGVHVCRTLYLEENEPLPEQRRRLSEEKARQDEVARKAGQPRRDYINTDVSEDEMFDPAYSEGQYEA